MEFSITRYFNDRLEKVDGFIEREEWITYVADTPGLEADSPRSGVNPLTGSEIKIGAKPDVGWLVDGEQRVAIQYNDGDLWGEGSLSQAQQRAILQIARDLKAVVIDENNRLVDW